MLPNGPLAAKDNKDDFRKMHSREPKCINAQYPMGRRLPISFLGIDILVPLHNLRAHETQILAQPIAGGAPRTLGYVPEEDVA